MFIIRNSKIFIFLTFLTICGCVELSCTYKTETDWWAINNVYFCEQNVDVEISKSNLEVKVVSGSHLKGKVNDDVKGFRIEKLRLRYFPQKMADYFPDLDFIAVWETGLKEIHQKDLAAFTNLKVLSLFGNDLEVIERNLLKFNPKIEYLGLGRNKIRVVDGKVFNHLNNLHSLHFDNNVCLSRQVGGNKHEVWDLVEEIEDSCSSKW